MGHNLPYRCLLTYIIVRTNVRSDSPYRSRTMSKDTPATPEAGRIPSSGGPLMI